MKKVAFRSMMQVAVFSILFLTFSSASGQSTYPTRAIELVITGPPGATADLGARYFGERWSEFLGQPIVPVNRVGGTGVIGTKVALAAKPDGYTLLSGVEGAVIVARLGKDMGYDLNSFRFFFPYIKVVMYLSVKADARWKNIKEFLAEAKKNPGKLTYGSYGIGAIPHYGTELLSQLAGVKLTYIPYKSSPEAMTALIGGHVDMAATLGLAGMSRSPLIRVLGVAEEERVWDHPDIPTFKEQGYPLIFGASFVISGPKAIPDGVVAKFTAAHKQVLAKYGSEIKEKLSKMDMYSVPYMDGAATMKFFQAREKKYNELLSVVGVAK